MTEIIGFDADQDCSLVASDAVRKGAGFVCRYLKNFTLPEAQALSKAGLKIVSIFESTAERALLGAAAGTEDGTKAFDQAATLGQPSGAAIYATADFDVTPAQQSDVLAYFAAFRSAIRGVVATSGDLSAFSGYALGIYGNGAICQAALDAGIADFTWLAGGRRMRGSQEFLASGKATIVQDVGDEAGLALGIDIDSDTAYSEDFGGWSLPIAA